MEILVIYLENLKFLENLEFLGCGILIFLRFLGEASGNPARVIQVLLHSVGIKTDLSTVWQLKIIKIFKKTIKAE